MQLKFSGGDGEGVGEAGEWRSWRRGFWQRCRPEAISPVVAWRMPGLFSCPCNLCGYLGCCAGIPPRWDQSHQARRAADLTIMQNSSLAVRRPHVGVHALCSRYTFPPGACSQWSHLERTGLELAASWGIM